MKLLAMLKTTLALASLCAPALAFEHVRIVDDDGLADFSDIQSAVVASTSGDAILVMPGQYAGFTLDGVGLNVLGMPGAEVVGRVRVRNLASGQVVVLSDLRVNGESLVLTDNAGSVRVQSCDLFGFPAAQVQLSSDVFFAGCTLRGEDGETIATGGPDIGTDGSEGASLVDSTVAFYDCELRGGDGGSVNDDYYTAYAGDGGDGCRTSGSFVFASNTLFKGGDGGGTYCNLYDGTACPGSGGAGLNFLPGSPCIAKLLGGSRVGGAGEDAWCPAGFCGSGSNGLGIWNQSSSSLEFLEGESRTMEIEHWALTGNTVQATFRGPRGDTVYLPSDSGTAFTYDSAVRGVWQLASPPALLGDPIGIIPPTGELQAVITLPDLVPGETIATSFRQAYFVDLQGEPFLGTPDSTVLFDVCTFESYCVGAPNSAGPGATMSYAGSASLAANDLVLKAAGAIPNQFGLFYYGTNTAQVPFGDGFRCVGGAFFRLPVLSSDEQGVYEHPVDFTAPPADAGSGQITWGATWNFQLWYRDPGAEGAGFNLSDALTIRFCP